MARDSRMVNEDRIGAELSSGPMWSEQNSDTPSGQPMTSHGSATLGPAQITPLDLETTSSTIPYNQSSIFSGPFTLVPSNPRSGLQASSAEPSDQVHGSSSALQSSALSLVQHLKLNKLSSALSLGDPSNSQNTIAAQDESRELCSLGNPWPTGQQGRMLVPFSRPGIINPMRTESHSISPSSVADRNFSVASLSHLLSGSGFGGGYGSAAIVPPLKTESSLEPGEIRSVPPPFVFGESGPETLGSINPNSNSRSQLIFALGVLDIMAMLSPRFQFKFGDKEASRIGARLTLYGHTILVEPIFATVDRARFEGCRLALQELRKYHPDWLFPPLPSDGPMRPGWDWTTLLADYCQRKGLEYPYYLSYAPSFLQWHGEVVIDNVHYRASREYSTEVEAQNRVAHIALRDLILSEVTADVRDILPADSQSLPEVRAKGNYEQLRRERLSANLSSDDDRGRHSNLTSHTWRGSRRAKASKASKKRRNNDRPLPPPAKKNKPTYQSNTATTYRPAPAMDEDRKKSVSGNIQPGASRGTKANRVPVANCRLEDMEVEEPVDNRLNVLKALQTRLRGLLHNAAYSELMTEICDVINVPPPEIRYEPVSHRGSRRAARGQYTLSAIFDQSHPFLNRASPIFLANVNPMGADPAESLGIKLVILYLLRMLREDANLELDDCEWKNDLNYLCGLILEIEQRMKEPM